MSEEVKSWARGNEEVLKFFDRLNVDDDPSIIFMVGHIYSKIRSEQSLRGEALHFCFKVLGHYDLEIISKLCEKVPGHILVKACSGSAAYAKRLVKPYLQ